MSRWRRWTTCGTLVALALTSLTWVAWAGRGHSNSTGDGGAGGGTDPTVSVAEIDGAIGGVVKNGRWTLTVPAGAFTGVGKVTLGVPDRAGVVCELDIKPGGLNGFAVPVELAFSTQGLTVDPETLTIWWYDPGTRTWVDVHGTSDPGRQVLRVPLFHFSYYRVGGKAGW